MTKREIRDEMVNVLLEAKLFPKFMQADMIKLGHTASVQPDSNIGYVIDAFAEAIYNRYEIYNQLNKSTIKNEIKK